VRKQGVVRFCRCPFVESRTQEIERQRESRTQEKERERERVPEKQRTDVSRLRRSGRNEGAFCLGIFFSSTQSLGSGEEKRREELRDLQGGQKTARAWWAFFFVHHFFFFHFFCFSPFLLQFWPSLNSQAACFYFFLCCFSAISLFGQKKTYCGSRCLALDAWNAKTKRGIHPQKRRPIKISENEFAKRDERSKASMRTCQTCAPCVSGSKGNSVS